MATSAVPAATTVDVTLAVLFGVYGSGVLLPTLGVAVMVVPGVAPALTCTTMFGQASVVPEASDAAEQVIVPVPLTAGMMQVHPAGGAPIDWNVVFGGMVKLYVGLFAVKLPRLDTV